MNNDMISRSALLRTCEAREVDAACNRAIWVSVLAMPFTGG